MPFQFSVVLLELGAYICIILLYNIFQTYFAFIYYICIDMYHTPVLHKLQYASVVFSRITAALLLQKKYRPMCIATTKHDLFVSVVGNACHRRKRSDTTEAPSTTTSSSTTTTTSAATTPEPLTTPAEPQCYHDNPRALESRLNIIQIPSAFLHFFLQKKSRIKLIY